MKEFSQYIERDKIILAICKARAKYTKQRNKIHLLHKLSSSSNLNYHLRTLTEDELLLNSILPSRKKWKKLDKKNRYKTPFQKINSIENAVESLLLTIKWYRKNNPKEPFLTNLDSFVEDIQKSFYQETYEIRSPEIYPKLKSEKNKIKNICRPISKFTFKDSLILSITNRYLTDYFDEIFYEHSLAFKSAKKLNGTFVTPTHHDAIKSLLKYKRSIKRKHLWVAESDMNKFFDSVSHSVIKLQLKKLLKKTAKIKPMPDEYAVNMLLKYLNCYSFTKNVLPQNSNSSYWTSRNIPNGEYGWVGLELMRLRYYRNYYRAKIGIPQGGALSGLIANIVLDFADQKLMKKKDSQLGYFRFCDDMLLVHPNQKKCKEYLTIYNGALKKLRLIPHEIPKIKLENSKQSYWNETVKSKGPYRWSENYKKDLPWIGFVGYEIHFNENLRIRRRSLRKELKKQKSTVAKLVKAVKYRRDHISDGTIIESATRRLLGMSIGRGEFWNINKQVNDMCLEAPVKLTTSGRGKLTTCFAGEDSVVQVC